MSRNIVIGLDVGTSAVKIVAAENRQNELYVLGAIQKPANGLRRGYVVDQDAVSQAIREAAKEAEKITNIAIRHAYISIGGVKLETTRSKGIVIVSRADNEITENDAKRAMAQAENSLSRIANRTIAHSSPIAFKVDGETVLGSPIGMKGEKLEADALFITCVSQHLSALVKSVEAAGIAVDDVVAAPLAASYSAFNKRQKEVGALLIDIGAETTSIAIFEESNLISLEVFPFGSNHITNDIALGLQISLEAAEELKFNYASDNQKRKLIDIIEARLGDIFELIENHLKKINRSGLLPAGAILTGGGTNLFNIENFVKGSLKLPAKIGMPFFPLKTHDKNITNPKWATALGLCAFGFSEDLGLGANGNKSTRRKAASSFLKWLKSFLP